jgi:predicted GIY-YIG superfamily endonuclease
MQYSDSGATRTTQAPERVRVAGDGIIARGEQKHQQLYLLHFDRSLNGRQHYLGWSENVFRRLEEHRKGQGGKTTAAYKRAGIGFTLAASWPGTKDDETQFKRKRLGSLCPLCQKKNKAMTTLDALLTKLNGDGKATISVRDVMGLTGRSSRKVVKDLQTMLEAGMIVLVRKGSSPRDKTIYSIPNRSIGTVATVSQTVSGSVPERTETVVERLSKTAEYIANSARENMREIAVSTVPRNGTVSPTAPPSTGTVTVSMPFCPESPELAAIYGTLDRSEIYVRTSRREDHQHEFVVDFLDIPPVVIPATFPDGKLTYWHHPFLSLHQRKALYSLEGSMRVFHVDCHLHALFFWIDNAKPARPDRLLALFQEDHRATETSRGLGYRGTRDLIDQAMRRISNFCKICEERSPSEQYYAHSLSRETDGLAVPPVQETAAGATEREADGE